MDRSRRLPVDARRDQALGDGVSAVVGQLPIGEAGQLFAGVLLLAETWTASGPGRGLLIAWFAALVAATLSELAVFLAYRRGEHRHPPAGWINRLIVTNIAASAVWGSFGWCIPTLANPDHARLLHLMVLCACSAGSVSAFSGSHRVAFWYLTPMWALEIASLAIQGHWLLAAGAAVFFAVMQLYVRDATSALATTREMRRREAELVEQLHRSETQARAVIETAIEAIWTTDLRGTIIDANPAAYALMGLLHDEYEGRHVGEFLPHVADQLTSGEISNISFEDAALTRRGQVRPMMVSISVVDPSGDGLVTIMGRDISERIEREERLAREAEQDGLTGLPNRLGLFRHAEAALAACAALDEEVAVIFVDLDRFKQVNDSLGHAAGDELLRQTSRRLDGEVRDGDVVARLGGDEFILLLPRPADQLQLLAFGRRLIDALEAPFRLGDDEARISASVGIASAKARGTSAAQLVANADLAMYRAKQAGRRQVVLFDEQLQETVDATTRLEQAFRRALQRRQLEAWLQPIVELPTGRVIGAELLTRWRQPGVGIVGPDVFIPIAEEAGLTADLGRWVLDRAADLLEDWAQEPALAGLSLSINLSGRHLLNGTVAEEIDRKLVQRRIDPSRLMVELTETDLGRDLDLAHDNLSAIRRLGVDVAIDDFGTGYSSLAYLQELPASTLKIDRRFIGALDSDARQATLVGAVLDLAAAFDLRAIAEGVETAAQAAALQRLGGRYAQGFLYGRPVPAEHFEDQVRGSVAGGLQGGDELLEQGDGERRHVGLAVVGPGEHVPGA